MTHLSPEPAVESPDIFSQASSAVTRLAAATADLFGPPAGPASEEATSVLNAFKRGRQ